MSYYPHIGHLSNTLKGQNTSIVADLMKAFMVSQDLNFIPELVQEVVDFKSFVPGYICDGSDHLMALGEMHLFKFYVVKKGGPSCDLRNLQLMDTSYLEISMAFVFGSKLPKEDR